MCLKEQMLKLKAQFQNDRLMNDPHMSPDILAALEEKENLRLKIQNTNVQLEEIHSQYCQIENEYQEKKMNAYDKLTDLYDSLLYSDKDSCSYNPVIEAKPYANYDLIDSKSHLNIVTRGDTSKTLSIPSNFDKISNESKIVKLDYEFADQEEKKVDNFVVDNPITNSNLPSSRTISFVYSSKNLSNSKNYELYVSNQSQKNEVPIISVNPNFESVFRLNIDDEPADPDIIDPCDQLVKDKSVSSISNTKISDNKSPSSKPKVVMIKVSKPKQIFFKNLNS